MRRILAILFVLIGGTAGSVSVPAGYVETQLASGLQRPVGLAFAPDGRLFIIEQYTGKIKIFKNGAILPMPFATVSPVYTGHNETGLLGIALHPSFATNGYVYVFCTVSSTKQRVLRYKAVGDLGTSPTVIVDNLPTQGINHNGGGIAFGPDGKLYVSVGDNGDGTEYLSQYLGSKRGKLLRYNSTGTVPTDNPFSSTNPAYCRGLRNTFRFCFQPGTGKIFSTENGPDENDEINILKAGKNYGWPEVTGAAGLSSFVDPILVFPTPIAPTGIAFYNSNAMPFQGQLFYCNYKYDKIVRVQLSGESVASTSDFVTGIDQPVDLAVGPDGALYYCTLPGKLYRATISGGNLAPAASFTASPNSGPAPLAVSFDAASSSDPDGSIASYAWDFGDGTTATGVTAAHSFVSPGSFLVKLTVTDNAGAAATTTQSVSVSAGVDPPPSAHIESTNPTSGSAPLTVAFAGHGHDNTGIVEHSWNFGDGSPPVVFASPGNDVNSTPSHTFQTPGSYTIVLTVKDTSGTTATHSATVTVTGGSSSPTAGYSTDFDSGYDWDWHLTGLWYVDGSPSSVSGGAYRSAPSSLNYNNRLGTFDTGSPNVGEAVSPVINVTHIVNPVLKFWCNYKTQGADAAYDKRTVRILNRAGTVLASHTLAQTGGSAFAGACDASGTWHVHSVPVDPAWRHIKVSFLFDSVDHLNNGHPGWFVDDLTVLPNSNGSGPQTLSENDFSTAVGWTLNGLWAVDGTPASVSAHSGTTSLNYNNGSTFNTGATNSGAATSSALTVSGSSCAATFWCNYTTETEGAEWDKRWVRIRKAADNALVAEYQLAGSGGTAGAGACAAMGSWHSHTISVDPTLGSVKIEFFFDTGDEQYNDHEGWFIDDLKIVSGLASSPALPSSAYATIFEDSTGWTLSGLWAVDGSPSGVTGGAGYNGTTSLNFNDGTDYDNGSTVAGEARSPLVDVSFLQSPIFTFKCNYRTETTGADWDKRWVRILDESDALLAEYQLATLGGAATAQACAAMGTWHEHSIPLNPLWKKVRVVFKFDSVDNYYNNYAGWFLDDLFFDLPDIKNIRKEMFEGLSIEGSGTSRKLRFSTTSGNAGYAPLTAALDAFEEDHNEGHNHLHFTGFVEYRLKNASGTLVSSRKTGFCFVNSYQIRKNAPQGFPSFGSCRTINPGFGDRYGSGLTGQELALGSLPDGEYLLDYSFDPDSKLAESDEGNNSGSGIRIKIQGSMVTVIEKENP